MVTKVIETILFLICQSMTLIVMHKQYHDEIFDIFNLIFQILMLVIFVLVIWIIL